MIQRKLIVESLEDRRVLSLVPVGGDGVPLPSFDPVEAGREMQSFYRELAVPGGPQGVMVMPMMAGMEEAPPVDDMPPHDEDGHPDRPEMAARQFVAILRPVESPTDQENTGQDGGTPGEGEPSLEMPPMPVWMRGGVARFFLSRDGESMRYRVRVPHLAGVDSATIHLGKPGSDGPAVATLFDLNAGQFDGIAVRGTLTDDDISPVEESGFDGTLASLVDAMRAGEAYVEVDTSDADGVLRGGVRPLQWRPWHNPWNRMDVTGDKIVSPKDALAVVEDLNENGARMVEIPAPDEYINMFSDVTGDNIVSPRDALDLIQFLNENAGDLIDADGNVQLPDTVSETVRELMEALEVDPSDLAGLDYDRLIDDVLSDESGELESLLDRFAEELQQEYEQRYSEWTGMDQSDFSMPDIDWEQIYGQFREQFENGLPPWEDMMGSLRDGLGSWDSGQM